MDQMLTRTLAIKENMDPMGRKWGIGKVRGTALFHIDVLEGSKVGALPEALKGKFTNPTLAQKAIEAFLTERWDESDKIAEKNDKKNPAKQ